MKVNIFGAVVVEFNQAGLSVRTKNDWLSVDLYTEDFKQWGVTSDHSDTERFYVWKADY